MILVTTWSRLVFGWRLALDNLHLTNTKLHLPDFDNLDIIV